MIDVDENTFNPFTENRPLRILILEDSELDVELLKMALKNDDFDFESRVCAGREEFEAALEDYDPDVILSDYALPSFTGIEALKLVKEKNIRRPFIIVTGAIDEETAVECIKSGADDYLLKDRLARLTSSVRHSIEQWKITIEKENTLRELEESRTRLQQLFKRIEQIRDEEKKRISLEIHDQLGQELTASKLGLFWLKQNIMLNIDDYPKVCRPLLDKIDELIDLSAQTIRSIRRISHQLRPVVLDDLGLTAAIDWMIKNFGNSTDITCFFNHDIRSEILNKDFSSAAYRIVQEGLTNIMRHSKATYCGIELFIKNDIFILEIWDNGTGFNKKTLKSTGKLGLFGIAERIKPFDGKMKIESEPGAGTRIIVTVPVKNVLK